MFREEPAGKSVRKRPLHLDIIETDLAAAYRSIYPARGKTLRLNVLPRLLCNLRTDAPAGLFDPCADGLMQTRNHRVAHRRLYYVIAPTAFIRRFYAIGPGKD